MGGGGIIQGRGLLIFKYFRQGEVIIQGRWLIERCLLFEEIWYFAFINELPPPPLMLPLGGHNVDMPLISFSCATA